MWMKRGRLKKIYRLTHVAFYIPQWQYLCMDRQNLFVEMASSSLHLNCLRSPHRLCVNFSEMKIILLLRLYGFLKQKISDSLVNMIWLIHSIPGLSI